ncbi:MAG: FAD-dependent oxidoreductase, partial [Spirochaetota bacterium]
KGLSSMGVRSRPYQIPYRSLVAKEVKGLLMAGRCISGGWLPHASYRVTGTAVSLGEAAGKAGAFCALSGKSPDEISWNDVR